MLVALIAGFALAGLIPSPVQPHQVSVGSSVPVEPVAPVLYVSETEDLDPAGDTVMVTGTGYDVARGIYVAFCVVPPAGRAPSPCGGGVDLEGASGSSRWISSSPPDYGIGLAEPYGPGGSFTVEIDVDAMLRDDIDCRQVQCAIVTRADHTRLADRSLDIVVPIFFATPPVLTLPPLEGPVVEISPTSGTAPHTTLGGVGVQALGPARGAAATWPVWLATGIAVVGLAAVAPRRRRGRRGRQP